MSRRAYPTDLTDAQGAIREPPVPPAQPGGRPPAHARPEPINAMLYVLRVGIAWRAMPHDLPPWQTMYHFSADARPIDPMRAFPIPSHASEPKVPCR